MVDCHTLENIQIGCRNDYPKATRGISKRCSGKSNSPSGDCGRIKNADNQKEVPAELKLTLDVEWTAEALGNVIKNCIEHSPEGGSIEIKAIERPLLTQVIIEDNGAGFQEKIYPIYLTDFIKEMVQRLAMPVWGWLWQKQSSIIRAASSGRKIRS